jgi:ERCC4-related helicase
MNHINHPLIKPNTVELRLYQEILVSRIIEKGNTLVVAPTALGKTIVALMLTAHKLKENPNSKILFLAPTKPLTTQHENSFKKFLNIDENKIVSITGTQNPKQRKVLYENSTILAATPQTIENDLLTGLMNLNDFSLVIFDEAHRAIGEYAYVFVNLQLQKQNPHALVVALTASPGSEEEKIQDVCKNLTIRNIEIKELTDNDVKEYVNEIEINWIKVDLPKDFLEIKSNLEKFMVDQIKILKNLGIAKTENKRYYNRTRILEMQGIIRKRLLTSGNTQPSLYIAASKCAALLKIAHAEELIETQGIGSLQNYFEKIKDEAAKGKSKASKQIIADKNIKTAIEINTKLFEKKIQHPKYEELKKILNNQFKQNPESKVLVFNHYRDSIKEVVNFLSNEKIIKAERFIGQATKGTEKGMNQKKQQEVLDDLRSGKFNTLVTSSVAEEGLDIPSVDLVVFFEPVPSEIRTIQRRGRTGRFGKGKMIILMAKNTRDEAFYWAAKGKERKMKTTLKNMKTNNVLPQQTTLDNFDSNEKDKVIIFVDTREQASGVMKELFEQGAIIRTKQLDVGDYIASKDVCIERKSVEDFLNSMIDGRLFNQLVTIRNNYEKPLLLLEGNMQEIFTLRNIHKNAVMGALTSIALDYQVPIINTKNPKETAEYIFNISKREQLGKYKEIRLRLGRKGLTEKEKQQFIIEGLPTVGPMLAKNLLKKFNSIKKIANASEKKLQKIENLGPKKAKEIYKIFNTDYKE